MQLFQLEKSRQATDAANIRAAYAEAQVASLEADGAGGESTDKVTITAKETDYAKIGDPKVGDKKLSALNLTTGTEYTVVVDTNGAVSVKK